MTRTWLSLTLGLLITAVPAVTSADTLIMRNGTQHDGQFVSGTSSVITFRERGRLVRFDVNDVDSVQFGTNAAGNYSSSDRGASNSPNDRNAPDYGNRPDDSNRRDDINRRDDSTVDRNAPDSRNGNDRSDDRNADDRDRSSDRPGYDNPPATDAGARPIGYSEEVIPVGTELVIRTNEDIDSRNARPDQIFPAQVDEDVVSPSGDVLLPRGTDARLVIRQITGGGSAGTPELTLDVQSVTIDGHRYRIDTSDLTTKGNSGIGANKRTGQMVGGGAVLGTIIGAIAGGGRGAAIGAVSGAAVGAGAQVMTRGRDVRVPSETKLRFRLDQPVRLRDSR